MTAGYKPEQVDIVVITHGHPDHIGGLMSEGGKPTYPNARYRVRRGGVRLLEEGRNMREARKANLELFMQVAVPFGEKATFLKGEGEVVSGIRAVNAYGHSPGMLAFHIESGGQRLLNWGDVANHYVMSIQQPEWHVGFDTTSRMRRSRRRKRIFDMVSTDKIAVVGYPHAVPVARLRGEVRCGYRWVPASYQFNL